MPELKPIPLAARRAIIYGAIAVALVAGTQAAWWMYECLNPGPVVVRSTPCARAMAAIGWKLPPHVAGEDCTETDDPLFESTWKGSFRVPRAEARPWLRTLHGDRRRQVYGPGSGADGVYESPEGLTLAIVPPTLGRIDDARLTVRWEGRDGAVVTFETYSD